MLIFCCSMLQPRILIVGAGAAGIAAASRLVENNLNSFTILEAENRIGGRILTSEFGKPSDNHLNVLFDLFPWYISCTYNINIFKNP